jgi:hypothetical protein
MPQSQEPVETMLRLLNGHCVEQALYVIAVSGIADLLRDGAKSSTELARITGLDGEALHRLLTTLAAFDVFRIDDGGHFALTALGNTLRSDVQNSLRDRAIFYGAPEMWATWGNLLHSVKTGKSAFEYLHNESFYQFLSSHPGVGEPFNRYMAKISEQHIAALLKAYDFAQFRTLVDVGGGHGGMLAAILQAYPELKGALFDLPNVVEGAKALDAPGIVERSERIGGDMNRSVPSGSDGYFLKWVLMDRPDEEVINVLTNCRQAMTNTAKIIAVEILLSSAASSSFATILDLQAMMLFGRGRLRDEQRFRELFDAAGLTLIRCVSTESPNTIIEGIRR